MIDSCSLVPLSIGDEKYVICTGVCTQTHFDYSVTIPLEGFRKMSEGMFIQNALPNISPEDREFLISGVSPEGKGTLYDYKSPYLVGHKEVSSEEDLPKTNIKWKRDWKKIKNILHDNRVQWLYHFTDYSNLESILEKGGLYSWAYSERNNIEIKVQGGEEWSRDNDKINKLQDYVRLSYVKNHPMMYVRSEVIKNPIVLKISSDVCFYDETLFTNMNAVSKSKKVFSDFNNFSKLKFDLFNKEYLNLNEKQKKHYQSEVLVKSFIPIKYIGNLYSSITSHI